MCGSFGVLDQVVIVVDQIYWTQGLGSAILALQNGTNPHATQDFLDFSLKQIDAMVDLVRCVCRYDDDS